MKIDETIYSGLQRSLRTDQEKSNEKPKPPSPAKDSQALVNESNMEAYQLSLSMVEKARTELPIEDAKEAGKVAGKLTDMILPNPKEAEMAHSRLNAGRVKDLLLD